MAIDPDEFDRLVARVDRLELGQHATIELVASEIVGLRTHVDEGFAAVDRRFDGLDARFAGMEVRMEGFDQRSARVERKLDLHTEQVDVAIQVGSAAVAENRRMNDVIIRRLDAVVGHLGIEVPEG